MGDGIALPPELLGTAVQRGVPEGGEHQNICFGGVVFHQLLHGTVDGLVLLELETG